MSKPLMKYVSCYLVVAMFMIGIVPRVYAGFSPSDLIESSQGGRSVDLAKIQEVLETKLIRERLEKLGFSPGEIQPRLDRLSDDQIHKLSLELDELRVAGDGATVVIVLLLIALGVVLALYLTGYKVLLTK